jgi:hypothetical protein
MVEFSRQTYRIMKINRGSYEVVRILDDARVGTFDVSPKLVVYPMGVSHELLMQVAMTALREAKVSWTGRGPMREPARVMTPPRRRDSAGFFGP